MQTETITETVRVLYHPHNTRPHASKTKVTFSQKGLNVTLEIGQNFIDKSVFAKLKAHPDFDTYVGWGAIEVIEIDEAADSDSPDSLLSYSLKDQQRIISLCSDRELLQKYLGETFNPKVKSQIQLRITAVEQGR